MPLEDKSTRRLVEREISKRSIDSSLLVVTVINGVATFKGRVSPLRGALGRGVDIKDEMRKIGDAAMLVRGVHEVCIDVAYDGG
jgi:hypothetical protein